MTHDPETSAAAYLAHELDEAAHAAYEQHLLTCDVCWAEVHAGRRGRHIAEQAREQAPAELWAQILDTFTAAPSPRTATRPARRILATAAAALTLVAVAVGVHLTTASHQPQPINAAVTGYLQDRLPGSGIPATAGPDLTQLQLTSTAASTGNLAGLPVGAYGYRDDTGRRLLIYVSDRPFPMPGNAQHPDDPAGGWLAHDQGVAVFCSRAPHKTLIVGDDEQLVRSAARLLDLTRTRSQPH